MNTEFIKGVSIYRPYAAEAPLHLLEPGLSEGKFDDALAALAEPARPIGQRGPMRVQELLFMRVAKHSERQTDEVVAAYVVRALTATSFALQHMLVDPAFRGRGLGRWLMGHAIGLAESKGAREMVVQQPVATEPLGAQCQQFLQRYGYGDVEVKEPDFIRWRFAFTPE